MTSILTRFQVCPRDGSEQHGFQLLGMQADERAEDAGYTEIQEAGGSKRRGELISEAETSGLPLRVT
jgi:hypothetical protein